MRRGEKRKGGYGLRFDGVFDFRSGRGWQRRVCWGMGGFFGGRVNYESG